MIFVFALKKDSTIKDRIPPSDVFIFRRPSLLRHSRALQVPNIKKTYYMYRNSFIKYASKNSYYFVFFTFTCAWLLKHHHYHTCYPRIYFNCFAIAQMHLLTIQDGKKWERKKWGNLLECHFTWRVWWSVCASVCVKLSWLCILQPFHWMNRMFRKHSHF